MKATTEMMGLDIDNYFYRQKYSNKYITLLLDCEQEALFKERLLKQYDNERSISALICIQKYYRGWKARCLTALLRQECKAATQIARIAQGFLARRRCIRELQASKTILKGKVALRLLIGRSKLIRTVNQWQEYIDSQTNEYFYIHEISHISQWLPPEPYWEFLECHWPNCVFKTTTMHEMHDHYQTIHIWYCPTCRAKVSSITFPICPLCQARVMNDEESGEVIPADEPTLMEQERVKAEKKSAEEQKIKDEIQQHRMLRWAKIAEDENNVKNKEMDGLLSLSVQSNSYGLSHEDRIKSIIKMDPDVLETKWITSYEKINKLSNKMCTSEESSNIVFAKSRLPFGSLYIGDFSADKHKFHGLGKIYYVNGSKYTGGWKNNERNGLGIFHCHDGSEYIGEWNHGMRHGRGVQIQASGAMYLGEFESGKYHGLGKYITPNGDTYEGYFNADLPSGQGIYCTSNGDRFSGSTVNGAAEGIGILCKSDGEVYKGSWENNLRHGSGVAYYANGSIYVGNWRSNKYSGHGTFIHADGTKYVGDYLHHERHGRGRLILPNQDVFDGYFVRGAANGSGKTKGIYRFHDSGNTYFGGWKNNQMHGKGSILFRKGNKFTGLFDSDHVVGRGVMTYSNGNTYQGYFQNAEKHGSGVYRWTSGNVYEGEFVQGQIHGFGKLKYSTGHSYEGAWSNNKKHGHGRFQYQNGDYYEGDWVSNQRHGQGKFFWMPGTGAEESYVGSWVNDQRHGNGIYRYANGNVYNGEWFYGIRQGVGSFTWSNGDFYRGEYLNEMQHGTGTFTSASTGETYLGGWVNNIRVGVGKVYYPNGEIFEGTFVNGERHGDGKITFPNGNQFVSSWSYDKQASEGRFILNIGGKNINESISLRVFGY